MNIDVILRPTLAPLRPFLIGAVAGGGPFVFMQLVPALLNPSLKLIYPNWVAVVVTSALIGAVASIIFSGEQGVKSRDIFSHALGIPAVLLGVVLNMNTAYKGQNEVAKKADTLAMVQERSSNTILNLVQPEQIQSPTLQGVQTEQSQVPLQGSGLVSLRITTVNWTKHFTPPQVFAQPSVYLVVLGQVYNTRASAINAYEDFLRRTLRTEHYVAKALEVLELQKDASYVVVYSRYNDKTEATKVYNLLRINDPEIPVRLIKWTKKG
jgi:hypothetical protein